MSYKIPESNKLIILDCDDFIGDYKIEGMFIDYKKPIKKGNIIFKSRFCTFNKETNQYESNMKEWRNRNSWSYK